ncbi:hypothetical protein [Pectobacterium versatile]|uniref:hypothetical protein n=1 Tax=Pectobacterium versatile TaxID=2488639 RepID=UPI0037F405FD
MTAEIAVYNKLAVALAADSAVTISGGKMYKINNGAEKLFALSKHHPVGVMVYGAGSLCGVPWEIIIKEFRKELGAQVYDTVGEYAEKFWTFLCNCQHIIPDDIRENYLRDVYLYNVFPELIKHVQDNRIDAIIKDTGIKPSTLQTYAIIEEECLGFLSGFSTAKYFENFEDSDIADALDFSLPLAKEACELLLFREDGIDIPESMINAIAEVFAHITCKQSPFGTNTGVVIAGYGDEEYFPAILAYDVLGFFKSKLRFIPNLGKSSSGGDSGVTAYAQEDEVNTFMQGMSIELQEFIFPEFEKTINDIKNEFFLAIEDIYQGSDKKNEVRDKLETIVNNNSSSLSDKIRAHIIENNISKVVEMIEFLPKKDLGYMAESLVNLTAFKRKVSNDSETVGGPIDVAIISKGDGFIWVKRKHYFDKELNHNYFNRL